MKTQEQVILVDEFDQPRGLMEKLEAHEKGELHRAFSIFIFNSTNELLIHRRADEKYHSPGLWTNTCCSHPRPYESLNEATTRRLTEEMGMSCKMSYSFSFVYRAELDKNLIEHEYDHVFIGYTDERPQPNPDEVSEYQYRSLDELKIDMDNNPHHYTEWFKIAFTRVKEFAEARKVSNFQ